MSSLLLELAGPQQSWGTQSRFAARSTDLAPSRSGVIGLLAAALGLERDAPLDRFAALRFGVRIDQPGTLERDFQTTRSLDGEQAFPLSHRHYLADAVFLAGLEGPEDELSRYREALRSPHFPLFLGRRAFPPAGPIRTWDVQGSLESALEAAEWLARPHWRRKHPAQAALEMLLDALPGEDSGERRTDVPLSFDPRRRRYATRQLVVRRITVPNPDPGTARAPSTQTRRSGSSLLGSLTTHDASALLDDEEV